jgi:hypothetical protein
VCHRCGTFLCALDRVLLEGRAFCGSCAALPEVDYLEAFRLRYWGRRDGWAFLYGAGGTLLSGLTLVYSAAALVRARQLPGPSQLLSMGFWAMEAAICAGFFFGLRWARLGMVLQSPALAIILVLTGGVAQANLIGTLVLPAGICLAIFLDTRNQLFFRVPISRSRLRRAWDLYANNTLARTGLSLSASGLVFIGLSAPGLICSIVALRRVDPDAHPPIGRRGQAIAGIVFGVIGTIEAVAVAIYLARGGFPRGFP